MASGTGGLHRKERKNTEMKQNRNRTWRSFFTVLLAAAVLTLSLTACGGPQALSAGTSAVSASSARSGETSASSAATVSSVASVSPAAPASSAAVSAVSSSSAEPAAKPAGKTEARPGDGVQTVQKITASVPEPERLKTLRVSLGAAPQSGYAKIDQRDGFGALSAQTEKDLYAQIGESVYQVADSKGSTGYYSMQPVELPSGMSEAQASEALVAYQDDNPQVFWLANAYAIGTQDGKTYLLLYSNLSRQQCGEAIPKLTAAVTEAMRTIPAGRSEFEREEAVFDFIADRCSYDNAAASDSTLWQSYTAYGALINGRAVCEGYSRAVQLLCGYAGVRCALVKGTANGGNHMWNCVRVDGEWYNLDLTWCDGSSRIYNYFNVTDAVLDTTHAPAAAVSTLTDEAIGNAAGFYNLFVPTCNSTLANYFIVRGIHVGEPEAPATDAVVSAVAERLKAGDGTVAFYIGPNGDFDTAVRVLLQAAPNYLEAAARQAGKTVNLQSVRYVADVQDRGINIIVTYGGGAEPA